MTPSSDMEDSGTAQDGGRQRVNNRGGGCGRGGNVNRAPDGSKFEGSMPSLLWMHRQGVYW